MQDDIVNSLIEEVSQHEGMNYHSRMQRPIIDPRLFAAGHVGHFTLGVIQGKYDPQYMQIMVRGEKLIEKITSSELPSDPGVSVAHITEDILTYFHESMHWFQDIATSYGQLWHTLKGAPVKLVQSYIRAHSNLFPNHSIRFPVIRYCPDVPNIRYYYTTAAAHLNLLDLYDGEKLATVELACNLQALSSYDFIDRDFCWEYWKQVCRREKGNRLSSSPVGLDMFPIGAAALMEGQAHAVEEFSILQGRINGICHLDMFNPRSFYGIYRRAFDSMQNSFGISDPTARRPEELVSDLWRFLAICDIALATPAHPIYRSLWKDDYSWADFHSGWRFARVCQYLSQAGSYSCPEDLSGSAYGKFASYICAEFNWPTPTELAKESAKAMDDDPVGTLSKRAAHLRNKNHAAFLCPFLYHLDDEDNESNITFKERSRLMPPPILVPEEDEVLLYPIEPPINWYGESIHSTYQLVQALEFIGALRATAEHVWFYEGEPGIDAQICPANGLLKALAGEHVSKIEFDSTDRLGSGPSSSDSINQQIGTLLYPILPISCKI